MLTLIIHHSGLELISANNSDMRHNAVKNDAIRRKKKARDILLDLSVHQAAIKPKLRSTIGRPDLIHQVLLVWHHNMKLLSMDNVKLIIHTRNNYWFTVPPSWRVPVSYLRFRGLMELFFSSKSISMPGLQLSLVQGTVKDLVMNCNEPSSQIIYNLTTKAPDLCNETYNTEFIKNFVAKTKSNDNLIVLIGGFQKGEINIKIERKTDIKLFQKPTTSWQVLSFLLHSFYFSQT